MTIKEITALRKNGQLDEALKAAEEEFSLNANKYTAGALFWCLNELCKKETDINAVSSFYERMKSLSQYCPDDIIMANSIVVTEKRLSPFSAEIMRALESVKSGGTEDELLRNLKSAFGHGELNHSLYADYGWLIYHTLKNTSVNNHYKRKQLLLDYLKLELPHPSLLHSLILGEAVKVEKNTPLQFRIRDFMNLWGWENLREEDWVQYKTDNGNTASSLVEKLIAVYAKELKTDNVESPDEFEVIVDKALNVYPTSQYMPFYKATILRSKVKNAEALDYYRKLILKTPTKFFLWHQASALVEDIQLKIALLCKAISVEKNESFIGGCRLDLAKSLIEKGLPAYAKYELDKYYRFYESQGWALKSEYYALTRLLNSDQMPEDSLSIYQQYLKIADEFIYSAIPSIFAIKDSDRLVDDRNRPGKKYIQWTLRTKDGIKILRKPSKYGLDNKALNGSLYDIKVYEGKIVWVAKSKQNPLDQDWIKRVEGVVKLRTDSKGKTYAIIKGTYISSVLLNQIHDGDFVKVIAIQKEDGRWSAISLKQQIR